MPTMVSSSGRVFQLDGPQGGTDGVSRNAQQQRAIAYAIIGVSILLSFIALVRLGSAASAAVASVSGAIPAASINAIPAQFQQRAALTNFSDTGS